MGIATWLLRPDDLLNLRVDGSNLRLDTSDAASPVLVVDDPQQPAYLVVEFPPQSIAEGAYYEAAMVAAEGAPLPARQDPDQPTTPPISDQLMDTPVLPGHLGEAQKTVAQVADPSRLVFRVPNGLRIPYTTAGLLDWSQLALSVNPIAAIGPNPTPEQIAAAPAIRQPSSNETAIELPWRLVISPPDAVAWDHRVKPFFHAGQCELWHTRMFAKAAGGVSEPTQSAPVPLRAIWTEGFNAADPLAPPERDPDLGRVAMSPRDRSQIVALTSAFHGYAADYEVFASAVNFQALPQALATESVSVASGLHDVLITRRPRTATQAYVPQPFFAEQLFLSPLGGWLKSRGSWDPLPRAIASTPTKARDFAALIAQLQPLTQRAAQPNMPMSNRMTLLNEHVTALLVQPSQTPPQLDLSEWVHVATQGRDHYVRIVYEGELWPFRHKAALIKVTERQFLDHDGLVEAHLVQRNFIVVREPEVAFADAARGMPFKRVRLTTRVTPSIVEPVPINNGLDVGDSKYRTTHRSFWVEVSGTPPQKFPFHGVGRDIAGESVDFTVPMMFVSVSDLADPANMALVRDAYNALAMMDQRSVRIPGQSLTFAPARAGPEPVNDNTRLAARTLNFVVDAAGNPPRMLLAEVNIPAVQQLLNTDAPTTIRYFQGYLDKGMQDAANQTGVFAEVVKQIPASYTSQNPFAGLIADTLGVGFSSDKAGGFATPDMGVSCLTSTLGSLAGDVTQAASNTFDPAGFFPPGGLAKIFGSFDLAELLKVPVGKPPSTHDRNAPKIQTATKDIPGGKLLTVTLDRMPDIQNVDLGIAAFEKDHGGTTRLEIHGTIQKPLQFDNPAAGGDVIATFNGKMNDFQISVLDAVRINFALFSFTSTPGQKADVTVNLDPATPLEFAGDLKFVEELRKAIPPGLFGDGPSLDLSPTGIRAGFELALPPLAIGVFALKDVALGAALTLPFLDGKPVFDFNVSQRCHPFQLAIAFFAGGGFFHLQLDTAGIKQLEAALEFGAAAAIDIGVASGEVHIMAGIYFSLQRKEGQTELSCTLAGYLRMGGSLSVLGLVKISVEFNLTFAYQADGGSGKAYGRATLTVQVEVLMFSKSVELTVEKAFGGSNGDPKFLDAYDTGASWNEYALAFA